MAIFEPCNSENLRRSLPVDKMSVVIAIALATIFLHERLTWHHWIGGLIIFTGATVLAYA
jgi:uncharacterized membrane protein